MMIPNASLSRRWCSTYVESVGNGYGIAIKLILKVVLSINGNSVPCRRECICCTLDYATGRIIRRN
jgi:hypothetical protein